MTISRLRAAFAALALALALPGALLAKRALDSARLEREARERAVAERAFDELERALSELLRTEEARPASDYDFSSAASPLRERPEGAIAVGWFQIEADGHVAAPSWAQRAARLAQELAEDGARYEVTKLAAEPVAAAPSAARAKAERRLQPLAPEPATLSSEAAPPPRSAPAELAPPTAQSVKDAAGGAEKSLGPYDGISRVAASNSRAARTDAGADAYDALAKLNTGAKEREQRKQRVYVEAQAVAAQQPAVVTERASSAPVADDARARSERIVAQAMSAPPERGEWSAVAAENGAAASAEDERAAPSVGAITGAADASAEPAPSAPREAPKQAAAEALPLRAGLRARQGAARTEARPGSELVRVVVDPMRGRLANSGELLLVRSAWIGDRGVRQGVVLDVGALERALASAALGDGALPSASLRVSARGSPRGTGGSSAALRTFTHRFAEPFDALSAELSFAPFADDGARSVDWLVALFGLAGGVGLLAVYRSTAIALHFAERRSNFAAAVSHELKTPLTAIRLYAEMLRDGLVSGDEKRREYYGSISAETERLSRLINNVLEFSRLERGARSLELALGDAAPVVREAVELLRPHAAEHGLALALAIDDALPPVRFERDALLQVVFNLVDNAIKYGRGEPPLIEIACRRAGEGIALSVRDRGPGVPRDELARILEPFYRRGDELTRSAPGAGIGLALVRSLAQQMGGAFRVANAEGGGLIAALELSGAKPS